jgi:predicted small secreted protein
MTTEFLINNEGHFNMFIKIRLFMLLSLAVVSLGLSACNTVEGAGKDIGNAGEAIEDAAN